jgi:gas vesicle protein
VRNTIENIIIALVVFIVGATTGGVIGYYASLNTTKAVVELQKETIEKAIAKETNSIKNVITNTFEKKAFKKGENVTLNIDSDASGSFQIDSVDNPVEKKRKRFFNRLLKNK